MALTEIEKQRVRNLRGAGKSTKEIRGILANDRRTGGVQTSEKPVEQAPVGDGSVFKRVVADIPSDIQETFTGATESVTRGIEQADEVRERVISGETTPVAGTLQTIGAGLRAGAGVVGEAVLGLGKAFFTPEREERIATNLQEDITTVVETPIAKSLITSYSELPEETRRNIEGLTGSVEGLTTMFGFAPLVNRLRGELSTITTRALQTSDDIADKARRVNIPDSPGVDLNKVKGDIQRKVKDVRLQFSDIDPQVETVLKRSTFDDVNKHFIDARNAVTNPEKFSPFEIVGNKAESAYDTINAMRRKAVEGKKGILANVADKRVPGNVINNTMADGIKSIKERFGIKIDADGTVSALPGRGAVLDATDTKLLSDYFRRLNSLGVSPTVQQVDDFIDWAQGQLYKQSKSLSTLESASKPVVNQLKSITGNLNSQLKDVVGGGYAEVNARIAHLINLQDEISRALGADARKGGGFIKRLFSPTGGNVRTIFEQIRNETGIDLFKEATLAKFAMESVGDVRANSLLKSLDVAVQEAAEFDITKPASILKFIREKTDLDGQELANEIIRKFTSEKS